MTRFMFGIIVLASVAAAQTAPSTSSLVAKNGAVAPSAVSPAANTVRQNPSLGVPPLPKGKTTLMGGTIRRVDHVRDRLMLDVFGGGHTVILFDERTRVFRESDAAHVEDLRDGQRAYVDTTLDGTAVFARNIRVVAAVPTGQGNGQIVDFAPSSGELTLRDGLSPRPVKMRLATSAQILKGDQPVAAAELRPGTLVALDFSPGVKGEASVNRISILASPGATFGFSGRVEHLDLHRGLLVLVDPRDNQSYEVYIDSKTPASVRDIHEGADISIATTFDGSHYVIQTVTSNSSPAASQP